MAAIINATDATFNEEVFKSDKPVLVDFHAPWCGPCKTMTPVLEEIAAEKPDLKVVKLDIDANKETPQNLGIRSIPLLMIVRNGTILAHWIGAVPKEKLSSFLDTTLAEPTDGITGEQYKANAEKEFNEQLKAIEKAARPRAMISSAVKIAGGLTLLFAAAAALPLPLAAAASAVIAFNLVRGASIFSNKEKVPDLYTNFAGRAFSAVSNATTTATGAGLFFVAATSGSWLAASGATLLGMYMFFSGMGGMTRDLRSAIGMDSPAAPAPAATQEKEPGKSLPPPQPH